MAWVLIVIAAISIWAISLFKIFTSSCVPSNNKFLSNGTTSNKKNNVLLVIAHPDDESMFFAPTVLFLALEGHSIHVLCLSTGNAEGKGNIRKEELYRACAVIKVPPQQVEIIDHPDLQDGFGYSWDHDLIAKIIAEEITKHNIDTLLTFDKFGVSGHPNHCDVHHGVCKLARGSVQRIEAWELISTNIFRKYIGPMDIWLSTWIQSSQQQESTYCLINGQPSRSYRAMAEHYSQWIWFRKLFVLFSSYTYMNTLHRISI